MQRPKRVIQFSVPMLCATIIVVLVLGFAGGMVARAVFPAKQGERGAVGKTGKQGPVGQAGPIGPTGPAANVNLSALGLCFGYNTFNDTTTNYTWVTSVQLYTPTVTNGTQSCPSGSFVPLQQAPGAAPA
jgi:hypothetical protein